MSQAAAAAAALRAIVKIPKHRTQEACSLFTLRLRLRTQKCPTFSRIPRVQRTELRGVSPPPPPHTHTNQINLCGLHQHASVTEVFLSRPFQRPEVRGY